MKKIFIIIIALATLGFPLTVAHPAFAAPGSADLRVGYEVGYLGAVISAGACNDGDESVEQFTLTVDSTTNYTVTSLLVNPDPASGGSTAEDPGTIDSNTGVWTGLVNNGECVSVNVYGDVTGNVGDNLEATFTVSDSILEGGTPNVDPNASNDSGSITPYEIVELPDIALQTRLLTQGDINVGTTVSYEIILHNVGEGAIPQDESMVNVVSFLVPDTASFDTVVDLDPDDELSSNPGMCFNQGPPVNLGSGLAGYDGTVISCLFSRTGDLVAHSSYSFQFDMIASASFVSGETDVYAIASGADLDTLVLQQGLFSGADIFETMVEYNNVAILTYDNDDLIPFINRCPGQNAITTNGTGCFRVSFNKLIWEPSFTIDDLELSAGTIASFEQLDEFTWEVTISGIPLNQNAILTLKEGGVLDYSAVENGVQVLGENMIRYEVAGNEEAIDGTASGELPSTGSDLHWLYGVMLILLGCALVQGTKRVGVHKTT